MYNPVVKTYFSTFIVGMEDVVKSALARELPRVKIGSIYDGLVIYQTPAPVTKIRQLRFFNNSFQLLKKFGDVPFEKMTPTQLSFPRRRESSQRSFRAIFSQENKMVPVNPVLLAKVEDYLKKQTGLAVNRTKPDMEFWLVKRSEGFGLFGLRLTQHPDYADVLEPGELRPELAHLLCLMSNPQPTDIFLDPFAGSGAIALERARSFPFKKVIASDIYKVKTRLIEKRAREENLKIRVLKSDATNLSEIASHSVTKIVTDPPWGLYDKDVNIEALYVKMLIEFSRLLAPTATVTILVSDHSLIQKLLANFSRFRSQSANQIIVSGKQATLYKIFKKS